MLSTVKAALTEWLDSDEGRAARDAWLFERGRLDAVERERLRAVEPLARALRRWDDPASAALAAALLHAAAVDAGDLVAAGVLAEVAHEALAVAAPGSPSLPGQPTSARSSEAMAGEGRRGRPAATQSDCSASDGLGHARFPATPHRAVSGPLATGEPVGSATLDTGGDTLAGNPGGRESGA